MAADTLVLILLPELHMHIEISPWNLECIDKNFLNRTQEDLIVN